MSKVQAIQFEHDTWVQNLGILIGKRKKNAGSHFKSHFHESESV